MKKIPFLWVITVFFGLLLLSCSGEESRDYTLDDFERDNPEIVNPPEEPGNGSEPGDTSSEPGNGTPGFVISEISGNTAEDDIQATFTIKLTSQPEDDVIISVSSNDETEGVVSLADGETSLVFSPSNWDIEQTVTITGVDDQIADGDISYNILLGIVTSNDWDYSGLNPDDVSLINVDDDTAGFTVSTITNDTTEAGGTATFTVKLNTQPKSDVTIAVSSDNLTEGTVSPDSLTFTSANWDMPQTITVTGEDDTIVDCSISFQVVLGPVFSIDLDYHGINPSDLDVTNDDDDDDENRVVACEISTNLMWQDNGYTTTHNWQSAIDYCDALSLAGNTDWRLPDIDELLGLYANRSILNSYDSSFLTMYWSSTINTSHTASAKYVFFSNGHEGEGDKSFSHFVRCVR